MGSRAKSEVREHVQARVIEPITDIHGCIFCKSENIKKDGLRHNKYGDIQKFYCKACGKWFTVNFGFERMKHSPQGITTAMQLYFQRREPTKHGKIACACSAFKSATRPFLLD